MDIMFSRLFSVKSSEENTSKTYAKKNENNTVGKDVLADETTPRVFSHDTLKASNLETLTASNPDSLKASNPDSLTALNQDSLTAPDPGSLMAPNSGSLMAPNPGSLMAPETKPQFAQTTPGDMNMLSNRSEPKQEEPTLHPSAMEKTTSIRQNIAPKPPTAVIGPKIRFKGELVGEEDLLVEGKVEGTIDLQGHNLTVGEHGSLQANVKAKTITVEGKVQGDLYGEERIAIRASSHVQGNIKAERVILEDGAKFRGSIDMDMDEQSDIKSFTEQLKETDASAKKQTPSDAKG